MTPKSVEVTLQAGASTDVAKSVQTTKLPPKSDFVFLADNTGSMGAQIDDVKANSHLRDLGEPGTNDRYRIRLSNGYDSGDRQLSGGNVQIH